MDPLLGLSPLPQAPAGKPLVPGPGKASAEQIREVSEQFEAIFMRQLVHGLRKTAEVAGETSYAAGVYSEMMDDQLAQHLTKNGGIGLATVIRSYLERTTR